MEMKEGEITALLGHNGVRTLTPQPLSVLQHKKPSRARVFHVLACCMLSTALLSLHGVSSVDCLSGGQDDDHQRPDGFAAAVWRRRAGAQQEHPDGYATNPPRSGSVKSPQ